MKTAKALKEGFVKCKFTLCAEDQPTFVGYYHPEGKYWNGWLNPYVTKEELNKVLNHHTVGDPKIDGEEWTEVIKESKLVKKGHLTNLLTNCFIWEEVE